MRHMNKEEITRRNEGFTLIELIAVAAIIAVLSVIIGATFIRYIERSREAKDLAAVRDAYTSIMAAVINDEGDASEFYNEVNQRYEISVPLAQTHEGWSTKGELKVGDISSEADYGRQWFGTPGNDGDCLVYYLEDRGVVIAWSKVTEIELSDEILPYFPCYYFEAETLKKSNEGSESLDYGRCATTGEFVMYKGDKLLIASQDETTELKEYELIIYSGNEVLYNSGPVTGSWRKVIDEGINGGNLNEYVSVVDDSITGETWYTFKNDYKMAINYIFATEDVARMSKISMAEKFRVDRKK